jgi:hypothetical protein
MKSVTFRFATDVQTAPNLLEPFDRIVVATGASYRYGLGPLATMALDSGAARWPGISRLMSSPKLRDWFYYRARKATGQNSGNWRGQTKRCGDRRCRARRQKQARDHQRL